MTTSDDTPTTEQIGTGHPGTEQSGDFVSMILAAIAGVAPELEPELADLDHDVDFWIELQLDSMDHLAVMTRLSEQTGIDIAERDYPHLTTITALHDFLAAGAQ